MFALSVFKNSFEPSYWNSSTCSKNLAISIDMKRLFYVTGRLHNLCVRRVVYYDAGPDAVFRDRVYARSIYFWHCVRIGNPKGFHHPEVLLKTYAFEFGQGSKNCTQKYVNFI